MGYQGCSGRFEAVAIEGDVVWTNCTLDQCACGIMEDDICVIEDIPDLESYVYLR